ncbi:Protein NRT1/ PTR family 5.6 [Vitis vinifera]|uniref:Protein NRT1/ PTR family 5.6 n=1 Tax=Vitis vinifera TaxID=29760 RepID=A0A438JVG9_VITVI|nr:Protein NRT1/ PTR family 5.6 [Vitis vinifera]
MNVELPRKRPVDLMPNIQKKQPAAQNNGRFILEPPSQGRFLFLSFLLSLSGDNKKDPCVDGPITFASVKLRHLYQVKTNIVGVEHCQMEAEKAIACIVLFSLILTMEMQIPRNSSTTVASLVYSHKFAEYVEVSVLITYFTDTWKEDNLLKAVAIVNVQEGLSTTMVIVMTYISEAHISRLKVIICSTAAYITGLVLLYLSALKLIIQSTQVGLFYMIVVLIAVGKAGGQPILEGYLVDQLRNHEPNPEINEDRVEARRKFWWSIACLTSLMGAAGLLFLCAIPFYHHSERTGSNLTNVFLVFKAALLKRHLDYPSTQDKFHMNDEILSPRRFIKQNGHQLYLAPQIKFFRWLDKAAIKESSSLSVKEQESEGRLFTVTQVKEIKLLLTMVPMWSTFIGFGLVLSTANTFFTEQGNDMEETVSIYILLLVSVAWRVEVRRLKIVYKSDLVDKPKDTIPMSNLWLAPQFFLLGLMEGFAIDGLVEFFSNHVSESMVGYGSAINDCVIGIGSFLNGLCVYTFRGWFADTINHSRLDQYYRMLVVVAFINLCYYWWISITIYSKAQ